MISQTTVEQVRAYTDIVAVISDYVSLKKRGRNFIGLCPFHSEKSPSFTVSPEKQLWHCFGCHSSGDHISFMMKVDNLTFVEAITHIAHKASITIVEEEKSFEVSLDERIKAQVLDVLFSAREAFAFFLNPESEGYRYALKRGLSDNMITCFHLGYAPLNWDPVTMLGAKGFSPDLIQKSGLVAVAEDGSFRPRFRHRLVFPVLDHRGRTVGFGARLIESREDSPKYINTEETILFNKRKLLYGLDKAKNAIRDTGRVIVMEGYMDVIVAHQYGFEESVGSMGTALTAEHAQLLKRYTSVVYLAMDSDVAGQQSVERSCEVLKQAGFQSYVIGLSQKDPADVLQQNGAEFFQKAIQEALPMILFKFNRSLAKYDVSKIEQIPVILQEIIPLLQSEKDSVIQKHYVRHIAKTLKINEELIVAKMRKSGYNVRQALSLPLKNKKDKYLKAQEYLIFFMATSLELRREILAQLQATDFPEPELSEIVAFLTDSIYLDRHVIDSLPKESLKQVLGRLIVEGDREELPMTKAAHWEECIHTLKLYAREKRIQAIKNQLKDSEQKGDDIGGELLEELKGLIRDE